MIELRWKRAGLALGAILVSSAANAQSMNAEAFHARAAALQAKGPLAILERDEINVLLTEAKAAGARATARRQALIKARKRPRFCPPEDQNMMSSDEYMEGLSAIPAAQRRRIDMTEATTRILAAKYPCRR